MMWEWEKSRQVLTAMIYVGAVYIFLQYLTPVLAPGLIALIFAMITGPFLHRMQKKYHLRRAVGAGILLLFAISIIVGGILFLLTQLAGELPKWIGQAEEMWHQWNAFPDRFEFPGVSGFQQEEWKDITEKMWEEGKNQILQTLGSGVMKLYAKYAGKIGKFLFFLLITILSVIWMADGYDNVMRKMLNKAEYYPILSVLCEVVRYIAVWVKAQLILLPLIFGVCACVLSLLGIKKALFLGLLAACLDVLPMIGTGFVLGPELLLLLVEHQYGKAVAILVLYMGCVLLRQTLEPKLIGERMGIPTLALILSIYGGITLFGVMGIWKGPLGFLLVQALWRVRGAESLQR